MHPHLTAALATEHQHDLARSAAEHNPGRQARSRSGHPVRTAIGRYFRRGPQAEQQSLHWADVESSAS